MSTFPSTNKQRLETVLRGQVPDVPPHFELMFQLGKPFFGLDGSEKDYTLRLPLKCVEQLGYAAVSTELPRMKELKKEMGDSALLFGFNGGAVFWMPPGDQIEEFCLSLYERPAEMHQQARQKLQDAKDLSRWYVDQGVDFFIMNSDFGFNRGPFISPDQFREFVLPYMTEMVRFAHEDLKRPVILHSDGDISLLLEMIHSSGIDGYQSVDPQGGMDIRTVRRQYPDWILMGNVPCNLLQEVCEEQIRRSVRECMTHGGLGKPYIFSTSNCIYDGMPSESYRIMLDEYRRIVRPS